MSVKPTVLERPQIKATEPNTANRENATVETAR
jgi:hypothetical protein